MADPARSTVVEALRLALRERFGASAELQPRVGGEPVPSGWSRVDGALGGGLRPSESALVVGSPGAGSLALASSWARETSRRGEPVLVLDSAGSSLPHAWIEPEDARAPIWALHVAAGPMWAALDIALRSGAFGMAVLLEPPHPPPGVGARVAKLARGRGTRVVITQWPGVSAPPWTPTHRIGLTAGVVRWVDGPLGAIPTTRRVEVHVGERDERHAHELDTGAISDRLRAAPRAPDRRPPSGHGGRTRRTGGASGPGDGGADPVG